MYGKLDQLDDGVYSQVPALDDEFSSDDFYPAVFELAALRHLVN